MADTHTLTFQAEDNIEELCLLGTKERVALALNGVKTVGDFLRMDLPKLELLKGYGLGTWQRLEWVQRRLQGCGSMTVIETTEQ
ncbi:MAG: hypothetical protein KA419_08430 [Acidobacteria bacterium]|nr:hypothetical protein [Acidobacteriota bacterium]